MGGGFVILDAVYDRYPVAYPFRIQCFRTLCEYRWDSNHLFLGESHNFWEATLVLEGEAESVRGEKVYLLQPGNLLFCPPMVFHSSRSTGAPCHNLNFTFEVTGSLPQILTEGVFYLAPSEISELRGIVHRLRSAFLEEPGNALKGAEAANALSSFLLRLAENHTPHDRRSDSRSSRLYQQVIETMQQTLYENLSIGEIAQRNAIGTTTLKDLFRNYAGVGPGKYYADMRGIEAMRLLAGGMEIAEIAARLNYSSVGYFSNAFKKQFGEPPGRFRKRLGDEML